MSLMIAILLEQKGELQEAETIYEDILSLNPGNIIAANNLAFYLAEHESTPENLEKAEALVEPFIEKYRANPALMDTVAWIQYRKGEFAKARDLLAASYGEGTDNPAINYHLGMIFLRLDEPEKGRKYLQLAMESGERFPGYRDAESALRRLSQ